MNLLEYVGNNPIAGLDPDGLKNCNAKEIAIVRAAFTACKAKAQTTYVEAVNAAKRRQDAMVAAAQTVKNGEYKLAASVYNRAKSACDAICDPGDREVCNTAIAEAKDIAEGAADAAFVFAKTGARGVKLASITAARLARAVQENRCLNSARAKCDNF